MKKFDYSLNYEEFDLCKYLELYIVGWGEQGVLMVEFYKSEILFYWCFKIFEIVIELLEKIYELFLEYKKKDDFVGMDMVCKFLQMGYIWVWCYMNYKGGCKYLKEDGLIFFYQNDKVKVEVVVIFKVQWEIVKIDLDYIEMKKQYWEKYEFENEQMFG